MVMMFNSFCFVVLLTSSCGHYRRCSNRVVEKGLTARLEVFRVAKDLPTDGSISIMEALNSNTWGVRTLDFIPKGGFVCELTGQYVLGKTATDDNVCGVLFLLLLVCAHAGGCSIS